MTADCDTITVEPDDSFSPSQVEVSDCTILTSGPVSVGGSVEYQVTVANNNTQDASATFEVEIGATASEQTTETVPGNDTITHTFTFTFNQAGTYDPIAQVLTSSEV